MADQVVVIDWLAQEAHRSGLHGARPHVFIRVTRDKNDASSLEKRASLLRYDSIHGDFEGSVTADPKNNALIINGTTVHIITANAPEEIDYTLYGIDNALVIDKDNNSARVL